MRIQCCIPFCKRTKKRTSSHPDAEWICGDHWRLIDKKNRKVWGRINKRWRRFGPPEHISSYHRLWRWMKRCATERAAGIA